MGGEWCALPKRLAVAAGHGVLHGESEHTGKTASDQTSTAGTACCSTQLHAVTVGQGPLLRAVRIGVQDMKCRVCMRRELARFHRRQRLAAAANWCTGMCQHGRPLCVSQDGGHREWAAGLPVLAASVGRRHSHVAYCHVAAARRLPGHC